MPPTPLRFLLALEQGSVKGHDDANGERVAPSTSYVCDPRGSAMYAIKDRDRAGDRASDRHEGAGDRSITVSKLPNVRSPSSPGLASSTSAWSANELVVLAIHRVWAGHRAL